VIDPEVEGYVRVEGGRLWAEWAGEGSGVVLAHAGIADSRQWDPQWDAITARHRVVRYDLRGFGRADVEHVRFSNRDDLIAVMDAAGLEHAVLVGCSRAGSIVVDTALEYPDRVSGVVHVCGGVSGTDFEPTPEEQAAFARGEALEAAKDWASLADLDVEIWVDGIGQPAGRAPAAARDLVRTMTYETYVQEKPYGDTIVLDPPAAGRLGELSMPVLVIQGLLDESGTIRSGRLLAEHAPRARLIELPDVAHMPNLERPEWFTETLLAFLAEVDAGRQG
jgi:pimeloyl-ACP methyl ester carboxylesterase